jgi:hypothetical protein
MSMLLFLPWCRIDNTYKSGDIEILPFERHNPIKGLDDAAQCRVNTIMASYKTIEGRPVDSAALICYSIRLPIDNLSEDEIEIAYELASLACFCGLAKREFFHPAGTYCNSDCFMLYTQKFDKADFTTFVTRRREGQTMDGGWRFEEIAITIPQHCHGIQNISLDKELLDALVAHRTKNNSNEWVRWQNAISCFNQANTDSYNVRHQVEWVLLCSAFEHLLGATPEAKDVASKLAHTMMPEDSLLASNANRRLDKWHDNGQSLRYEWMREFYRIRGDFAHGKLKTQQPTVWYPLEHLVLATIAFSLVVKYLLKNANVYDLTIDDQAQIDAFEKFADTNNLLNPPSDQKGSIDSHWRRLCNESKSKRACKEAVRAISKGRKK